MKIYLSGPISNNPIAHQLFSEAEYRYSDMGEVINPLKYNNIDTEWIAAMRNDIALFMQCDTIVMLQGWEQSKGAQIEHFIAILLNFNIIYDSNKKVDITDAIIKKICTLAGKNIDQIKCRSRKQDIVFLRHIICYILHKKGFSLSQIGLKLNRNHATVLHSIRVVSDMLTYPNPLNDLYNRIIQTIKI